MGALKQTHIAFLAALLVGLGACPPGLRAQDGPYSVRTKIRLGLTAGGIQQTHFDNKLIGFAAEMRRDLKDMLGGRFSGALTAELAWDYVPGRHHDIYPWDTNLLYRYITTDKLYTLPGLDIQHSFDDRKEYGVGFNLRLGYSSKVPQVFGTYLNDVAKDMEWFAGLGIDRYKVRSEVHWTFYFWQTNNPPSDPDFHDGGAFTEEQSQIVPGAFAGLRYKFNSDIGLELSLRNFGMWHYEFAPNSYHTTDFSQHGKGVSSTGTSRGWALEFAVTVKM